MKATIDGGGVVVLEEVYRGLLLRTSEGNEISVCMRDNTFEINVMPAGTVDMSPNWWRVDMQDGSIKRQTAEA